MTYCEGLTAVNNIDYLRDTFYRQHPGYSIETERTTQHGMMVVKAVIKNRKGKVLYRSFEQLGSNPLMAENRAVAKVLEMWREED